MTYTTFHNISIVLLVVGIVALCIGFAGMVYSGSLHVCMIGDAIYFIKP